MAHRIQEARKAAGFASKSAFARALKIEGVSDAAMQVNVSRWESNVEPNSTALAELARALGCSIDWLVTGEGQAPAPRAAIEEETPSAAE